MRVRNLRVRKHLGHGWHRREEVEGRSDVLPWYHLVGVVGTSSETLEREELGCLETVLTCTMVTGKAGENG